MVSNVFKRGFDSVENMKQEQQASKGNGIYDFYFIPEIAKRKIKKMNSQNLINFRLNRHSI